MRPLQVLPRRSSPGAQLSAVRCQTLAARKRIHSRRRARRLRFPSSSSMKRTSCTKTHSTTAHPAQPCLGQQRPPLPHPDRSARPQRPHHHAQKPLSAYPIYYRLFIEPLSPVDTADYIRARLMAAGASKELFAADAIAVLHEAVSGSLRDTDRGAHNALRSNARRKRKLVERDVVQAILQADAYVGSVT